MQEFAAPFEYKRARGTARLMAALHNAGNIDLLALTTMPEFRNLDRGQRFTIQASPFILGTSPVSTTAGDHASALHRRRRPVSILTPVVEAEDGAERNLIE